MKIKNKVYLIIGFGRFSQGFTNRLIQEGISMSNIYIIDSNKENLESHSKNYLNIINSKISDLSDIEQYINPEDIDIIVIGTSSFEDSLSIASCFQKKEYQHITLYAKASNELHKRLLRMLSGTSESNIVIPEKEIGDKMALRSLFELNVDIENISNNICIINILMENQELNNLKITDITNIWEKKFGPKTWNIISVMNNTKNYLIGNGDIILNINNKLSIICEKSDRKNICKFFSKKGI